MFQYWNSPGNVMSAAKPVRVGIVGANWSLKVHGTAWRMRPGVEVAAVCTAHRETAEAAAQAFGVPKAYWNVEEMAGDPDIDVIDVGSRPAFRYDMVKAAFAGGKHVYDALPFAVDARKARDQLDAQRKAGKVGIVDAQFRWVPAGMQMKRLVDQGFLGTPLGFNVQLLLPLLKRERGVYPLCVYPEGGISPYRWLAEPESGASGWRNFGSHTVLFLTHLLGEVEQAAGVVRTGVPQWKLPDGSDITSKTADLGSATLCLKNGAIGNLQTGWCQPDGAYLRVEVWGDRGRLLLEDPTFGDGISARLYAAECATHDLARPQGQQVDIPASLYEVPGTNFTKGTAPPYMVSMGWMFHDMVRTIREGGAGSPNFAEAYHAHRVVEAVMQSQQSGRWVKVDEVG
jgi:predicted dehydrogenase